MTKEKSSRFVKIVLPILIVAIIGAIWFVKNKPEDNLDTAVQTSDITALNNDSADKVVSVNPTDKVANGDDVTENPKPENKEPVQKTENTTLSVSEETKSTSSSAEGSIMEGKLETATETVKKTEEPASTQKPETLNADFALAATAIDLEKLKSYGLPIIIDFGADSCVPCKLMAPVLKKLNTELRGKVIVKFVDVWKYKDAAANFPVEVIPTQFFFDKNGKPYVPSDPDKMQMNTYSKKGTNEHIYTSHQGGLTEEQIMAVLAEMGVK